VVRNKNEGSGSNKTLVDPTTKSHEVSSVADTGCFSRIPDQNVSHPGSEFIPSRIRIKEMFFNPKNLFPSSKKYDPDFTSRIWILTFYPSRILGSKRHRIPDSQHWNTGTQAGPEVEERAPPSPAHSRCWQSRARRSRCPCAEWESADGSLDNRNFIFRNLRWNS
jgi:hypothetical protein